MKEKKMTKEEINLKVRDIMADLRNSPRSLISQATNALGAIKVFDHLDRLDNYMLKYEYTISEKLKVYKKFHDSDFKITMGKKDVEKRDKLKGILYQRILQIEKQKPKENKKEKSIIEEIGNDKLKQIMSFLQSIDLFDENENYLKKRGVKGKFTIVCELLKEHEVVPNKDITNITLSLAKHFNLPIKDRTTRSIIKNHFFIKTDYEKKLLPYFQRQ